MRTLTCQPTPVRKCRLKFHAFAIFVRQILRFFRRFDQVEQSRPRLPEILANLGVSAIHESRRLITDRNGLLN